MDAETSGIIAQLQNKVGRLSFNAANQQNQLNPSERVETIRVDLPTFNGKNNPEIWIAKIEAILTSRKYHIDRWTNTIVGCMKEEAETWWYNLTKEYEHEGMSWDFFKGKLLEHYNYCFQQIETRQAIYNSKFRTAEDYIEKFKRLSLKIPKEKLSDWETQYLFI